MTKFYKFSGVVFLLMVLIMSCKEEDPKLPLPVIDFTTDPEIVEVGVPVKFQNLTTNASNYEWDFGDGQTSTQISPTITYDEAGTYSVKLVAFTKDNQKDSLIQEIMVGERVMTGLLINSFPFVNMDGNDWDDPTGFPDSTKYPDFILFLYPQDDQDLSRFLATPLLVDLAPFELPIGFELNPGDPYVLTNETWELTFIDFDGEDLETAVNEDFEIMEIITFNPVTIPTGTVDENGEGFVQISLGTYSVDLFFQIE